MNQTFSFDQPMLQFGNQMLSAGHVIIGGMAFLFLIVMLMAMRGTRSRAIIEAQAAERARDAEMHMASILQSQAEMQGRMQTMAELFGSRQAELNQAIRERLDGMTNRLGQTMTEQTRSTHENLRKLQERLAVIDNAQGNIQQLAGQVVQLQEILNNKQTRGAFGQSRMEAIIADGLPQGAYEFQATLSNGNRPDCLVRMPNGAPSLVIDAKFPLEAWNAIRGSENPDGRKAAGTQFRRDMEIHIRDIAAKYLISGETQDTAFLFVPSESVFAEIHENFEAVVQRAHRERVVIVSPSLLMLSIQVIQAVLKDARMREQAHLIQAEVIRLMEDVARLDERVRKLQTHFQQTGRDIDDILVSTSKVTKRGQKIEALEFRDSVSEEKTPSVAEKSAAAAIKQGSSQLRLHIVDTEE